MYCPYCKSESIKYISDSEHLCCDCGENFESGTSDGNKHSLSQISADFPGSYILGEILTVSFKRGFKHCDSCGTVYDEKVKMCPTFKEMLLNYYETQDDPFLDHHPFSILEVRRAINEYFKLILGSDVDRHLKKRRKKNS